MAEHALQEKTARLVEEIRSYGSTIVAFSGGVDSALVARAAKEALGAWAIAAISDSPTVPRRELEDAHRTAESIGIRLFALERDELDDPAFVRNDARRCYFCKKGLQEDLEELAREVGAKTIAYGVNLGDLHEWRPGIEAARERGARFPLVDAAFDKATVRAAARQWGLPVWDKPAAPCLSSRIPYGQPVTEESLRRIERAEDFVRRIGFRDVRVRDLSGVARVEVPSSDVPRLFSLEPFVAEQIRSFGFSAVLLDPRGLRSGRLNEEYPEALPYDGPG